MQSRELVKLYYRIGEVSEIVGVQPHVLRYWETEFRSIRPQKSSKGQRVYSRRDVEKLLRVKDLLRNQGFTIAGARKRLSDAPEAMPAATPLSTLPLSALPLSTVPLSTVPLSTVPLSTVPPSTVPLVGSPLSAVPPVVLAPALVAAVEPSGVAPVTDLRIESRLEHGVERGPEHRAKDDHSAKNMRRALLGLRHDLLRMLEDISSLQSRGRGGS